MRWFYEPALLTGKVPMFDGKWISLLVQTWIRHLCFNLFGLQNIFTTSGRFWWSSVCYLSQKLCENSLTLIVLSLVANYFNLVFQNRIKQTIRTNLTKARSVPSHMSVQCVWVCVCSMFLLKLSFRKAPGPRHVCTDLTWAVSLLLLSKYQTSGEYLS